MVSHFFRNVALFTLIQQFIFCLSSSAQINGKIIDSKTGKPLPGVEVFINRTTVTSSSDDAGQFNLKCTFTGFYDLVLYKPGYSVYRSSMKIQSGHLYTVNLTLARLEKKRKTLLTVEESKIIKNSLNEVAGPTPDVKLLNEEDLGIARNDGHQLLVAKAPLLIRNETTGYLLKYYVSEIPLSEISRAPVLFENLPTSDINQNISWEKNRKEYFNGSLRHWLMAAVAGRMREEGFSCRDADGNEVDSKTLVSSSSIAGYKKINIDKPLLIHHQQRNVSLKISRLTNGTPIDVSEAGLLINSKALVAEGQMIKTGLADQLPVDYLPIVGNVEDAYTETMMRFYEKVYVHTDKPYYYPGESVWFKAYLNYYYRPWRDSLSRTLYVELISPNKKILMERVLKIDSGFAHNDFILPDSLKEGNYYLRAYTNLNRNFGDSSLYVKVIPILNLTNNLNSLPEIESKSGEYITITSNKKKYHTREKIKLAFEVKGKNGTAINSNLSVSVTDAGQVVPILDTNTILNANASTQPRKILKWQFNTENGVGFTGRFVDDWSKSKKVPLTIIQTKPRKVFFAEANDEGIFSQSDLDFYDTLAFAFKQGKSNKYSYGKFELLPREIPSMSFKESEYHQETKATQSRQRIVSEYKGPNDFKMLKEVVVKARKIYEPEQQHSTYGKPDATLTEKDFKSGYPNILYSIVGKVPGLVVDPGGERIAFSRSMTQSISNQSGPLLMINDVPLTSSPDVNIGSTLAMINPASIESISFTKRLNVLYGSQGNAGVISVYLKKGVSLTEVTPDFQTIKIGGYSSPHTFRFPDYDDFKNNKDAVDYRATIYWNPQVETRSGREPITISFFAADLPGKYRVVAEGVTEEGEVVRGEAYIEIENE
ncbi:MAG: carboxypeptidase-like regulatory domain-containing protein [Bacteroidetes bacterium]|nr:carboxypeptidase-like regulatory domain-containing protein [Bacteroidota bacterium]